MNRKKDMLRRAAAFVSALSFLSVSNMGTLSVIAADTTTTSGSSATSTTTTAPALPEKSGGSTGADAKVETVTSDTYTAVTTTAESSDKTATTTTTVAQRAEMATITTTAANEEYFVDMPSNVKPDNFYLTEDACRKLLYEDAFNTINNEIGKAGFAGIIKLTEVDKDHKNASAHDCYGFKIEFPHDNTKAADAINTILSDEQNTTFIYEYTPDGSDRLINSVYQLKASTSHKNDVFVVKGFDYCEIKTTEQTKGLVKSNNEYVVSFKGKYYIKSGAKINNNILAETNYKYFEGLNEFELDSKLELTDTELKLMRNYKDPEHKAFIKEKKAKITFYCENAYVQGVNREGRNKYTVEKAWSDIDKTAADERQSDGKIIINAYDGNKYQYYNIEGFDANFKFGTGVAIDSLISSQYKSQKNQYKNGAEYSLNVKAVTDIITINNKGTDDDTGFEAYKEQLHPDDKDDYHIPYFINQNGVEYYLCGYSYSYADQYDATKTGNSPDISYETYEQFANATYANKDTAETFLRVHRFDKDKDGNDSKFMPLKPGEDGVSIQLTYRKVDEGDSYKSKFTTALNEYEAYSRGNDVICLPASFNNYSLNFKDDDSLKGYTFYYIDDAEKIHSLHVTEPNEEKKLTNYTLDIQGKYEYIKFTSLKPPKGKVVPIESLYIYADGEAPTVTVVNDTPDKFVKKLNLKISVDDYNKDTELKDVLNQSPFSSIEKVVVGTAVIDVANGKKTAAASDGSYNVKLTPVTDNEGNSYYDAEITVSENSDISLNQNLEIYVTDKTLKDKSERKSNIEEPFIKIDNSAPSVGKMECPTVNDNGYLDNSDGNKINVILNDISDEKYGSKLKKVTVCYSLDAEPDTDDKSRCKFKTFGTYELTSSGGDKYKLDLDLDISEVKDSADGEGYLIVDVEDNAIDESGKGNTRRYYYHCPDEENQTGLTTDLSLANTIGHDTTNPPLPELTAITDSKEVDGKIWFTEYPEFKLSVSNSADGRKTDSPLSKIEIKIKSNGQSEDTVISLIDDCSAYEAISKYITKADYTISFTASGNKLIPVIAITDTVKKSVTEIKLAERSVTLPDDGKFEIEVRTWDKAGNQCEGNGVHHESFVYYVDNKAPDVINELSIDESDSSKRDENAHVNIKAHGVYSNHELMVRIPLMDGVDVGSSGFESAEIKINNKHTYGNTKLESYDTTENVSGRDVTQHEGYVVFRIPDGEKITDVSEGNAASFSMIVTVKDKAGNISEPTPVTVAVDKNGYGENRFAYSEDFALVIDKKAPELTLSGITDATGSTGYDKNGELWFSEDVTVAYNISDIDSGLADVSVEVNDEDHHTVSRIKDNYADDVEFKENGLYQADTSNTDNTDNPLKKDGKFEFSFVAHDNAGNSNKDNNENILAGKETVFKDITAPVVTGFTFEPRDDSDSKDIVSTENDKHKEEFATFKNDSVTMTVNVSDSNASSGIAKVFVILTSADGKDPIPMEVDLDKYDNGSQKNQSNVSVSFAIEEGFKGDIVAWAVDNVGRVSGESSPKGYISENDDRHKETASVEIQREPTEYRDNKGLPLYNKPVDVTITVADTHSGINSVKQTSSDNTSDFSVDHYGKIDEGKDTDWNISEKERNIVKKIQKKITVSSDNNNNFVHVDMTDNTRNNSVTGDDNFSIDMTAPNVEVKGIDKKESNEVKYYNTHKTAHIEITERNFTDPEIDGRTQGGFELKEGTAPDSASTVRVRDIHYNSDGRYNLDIKATDLAGNSNENSEFHSATFVIDTTAPTASINVSRSGGSAVQTGENTYIDSDVDVSVVVNETNFDPNSFVITINDNEFRPGSWSAGEAHTAVIPSANFSKDGKYTITVTGKDLAGNSLKTVTSEFTVDRKKPEIKISGVSAANNGEVAPVINIKDDNLDAQDVKVYKNGKLLDSSVENDGETVKYSIKDGKFITGRWSSDNINKDAKNKMIFENFPEEEEFDGSYRIDVDTKDKAENEGNESLDFSVNRFGSTFTIQNADEINGKHLNKVPTIVIVERNVDKHDSDDSIDIIIDKGSNTVKLTSDQYTVTGPEELEDKSGYEYTYTIDPVNFSQDLDYSITIQAVDAAGNHNNSAMRGADLSFSVDTHIPEFECDDLIDRAEFRQSEREFRLNVNERLKHIRVSTSLDEVLLDEDGKAGGENSYTFAVPASNTSRDLTIELTDLAGNLKKQTFTNLLVTENVALYVMHKTWAKAAAAAAVLGIGATGGILFARKRKKNS